MRPHSLTRDERLRRRPEFLKAGRCGRRLRSPHFSLLLCPNETGMRRLGITASRKVGSATQRNRVKRLIREFFRLHKGLFPPGHDAVVIARAGAPALGLGQIGAELTGLLEARRGAR